MKLYPYIVFNFIFRKRREAEVVRNRCNSELANQEI